MSYTLIVIDVQSSFTAAKQKRVLTNCEKEIDKAIKNNCSIVFVEYFDCGKTSKRLTNLTINYRKTYIVTKYDDDGSPEILSLFKSNRLPKNIKVCGVNTDACVLDTVCGLSNLKRFKSSKIEVISNACGSDYNHKNGLDQIAIFANKNVRVK
ncbi:Isochorismatase-like [uncultured Caudovirales phage]|uniref:Isochorismatase-like n=1 Tax=uncultured Caudovirales phage TaxID=2100421 RepID=A0A6J5RL10_9CAUD|nr:Isochorismatase-like [uncultured Caudovirales phage]